MVMEMCWDNLIDSIAAISVAFKKDKQLAEFVVKVRDVKDEVR